MIVDAVMCVSKHIFIYLLTTVLEHFLSPYLDSFSFQISHSTLRSHSFLVQMYAFSIIDPFTNAIR